MKTPYQVTDLAMVQSSLTEQPLMFDTETDKLYGTIILAQFYQESWDAVLVVNLPDPEELIALLDSALIVLQNSHYDITTLQIATNSRWVPKQFHDVLLLSRLYYYLESSFTLDNLMLYSLGYDPYLGQDLIKKDMQKMKWLPLVLTEEQLLYASTDVFYLPQVYNKVKKHVEDPNYLLDMQTLRNCLDMQNNGFPVNSNKRLALELRNQIKIDEMDMPINVNSYKQVRPYIGEEESDALALTRFELDGNEKAGAVNKTRKLLKTNSFLKKFDTPNNRIYGKFAPSARSGRLTCKDQNLQQIPRNTKGVFGFNKKDGKVLVYADFSQLELRCACAIIGERKMAKLFYSGEDLHSYTKQMLFGDKNEGKERYVAKTCNFNLLYGGSANMLGTIMLKQASINIPEPQLHQLRAKWLRLWPSINQWQQDGINAWSSGEHSSTPMGRRYLGKLMTDHLNIEIQGSGADVAKLSFNRIMDDLRAMNKDLIEGGATLSSPIQMLNFIHDSYIIECPEDEYLYSEVAKIVARNMKFAWEEMSKQFKIKDIPMPVSVHVGYNWGDIESDDVENIYNYNLD